MTEDERLIEWTRAYYGSMVGLRCVAVDAHIEDGECWPVLTFEHPKGGEVKIEVSRDEEGNGPGFLFGLPFVREEDNPFLRDREETTTTEETK